MTDKPIVVYWFTALACRPRPIQVATTSHLQSVETKGKAQ